LDLAGGRDGWLGDLRGARDNVGGSHGGGSRLNRRDDVLVSGAPAIVSFEGVPDLLFTRIRIPRKEVSRRENHAWGAEAALKSVLLPEGSLQWVK
jgi:hypothetical protein